MVQQKGHPAVDFMIDRRIFERYNASLISYRQKLHWSRDITWHGHLREKVKFLVSVLVLVVVWVMVVVRVMVRVRVEC